MSGADAFRSLPIAARRWGAPLFLAASAVVAAALWRMGLLDPRSIGQWVAAHGAWGALLFLACFTIMQPVPGFVFVMAAALIWPKWSACSLSMAGALSSGAAGYALGRWGLGRSARLRNSGLYRRAERWAGRNTLRAVVLARLVLFLVPPIPWAFGAARARFGIFMLGSLIGLLPGIALLTWTGRDLLSTAVGHPLATAVILAVVVAMVLLRMRLLQERIRPDVHPPSIDTGSGLAPPATADTIRPTRPPEGLPS